MANIKSPQEAAELRRQILHSAAKLFLMQGFANTSIKEISKDSNVSASTIFYEMKSKEEILAELVAYVLEFQFSFAENLLKDTTDDPILFYAAETTLQLHIAESSEHIRELYNASYSLPKTTEIIQHTITAKLETIFKEHLPHLETKDFFELEIASGGIMRGFLSVPCNMYFTMERKIKRFLETTFILYHVPDEKIQEAIDFVSQFDYPTLAQQAIDSIMNFFEKKI
ncbi:MAG: TetR/AcrR family transcriptional regulator [Ruminococcaceae bacterium]|nr:TetR/AcrR family transcriptional regulator [Oscillospiraceae bacterium]